MSSASVTRNMKYVYLGKSGLKVSQVILGAMSYGSSKWQEWVLDEEASLPLLKHAYDRGINTWDTVSCFVV
jgi:aryl-alcohol dehydrogenase-like predicted oxidoreductase